MRRITIESVDNTPHPREVTSGRRLIGDALGTSDVDLTHFQLQPGDQFSGAYHRHLEREEVFVILSGTATFRTEKELVDIEAGEAIYFGPGDWQLGYNDGSDPVEALLIGVPKQLAPVEAELHCPDCDRETTFRVYPETQESGTQLTENRRCLRCGGQFEM